MRRATLRINRKSLAYALVNDFKFEIDDSGEAVFSEMGTYNSEILVKPDFMPHMRQESEEADKALIAIVEEHLLDEWYINMGYYIQKTLKVDGERYADRFLYKLEFYYEEGDLTGLVPKSVLPDGWKPKELTPEQKKKINDIMNSPSWKGSASGW